jgi:YbbR domain-containing protein
MVLINKISNIIRESIDVTKITNSALKELSIMMGAFKSYYASATDKTFKIEEKYYTKKPTDFFGIAGISYVSCSS